MVNATKHGISILHPKQHGISMVNTKQHGFTMILVIHPNKNSTQNMWRKQDTVFPWQMTQNMVLPWYSIQVTRY